MSALVVTPCVPGGALLALQQVRDNGAPVRRNLAGLQPKTDLAELRSVAQQHGLPMPDLLPSRWGVVGVFRGASDVLIEDAVREWAEAFTAEVVVVDPTPRLRGYGKSVAVDPGWVVMHACVRGLRFTVGGVLVEAVKV